MRHPGDVPEEEQEGDALRKGTLGARAIRQSVHGHLLGWAAMRRGADKGGI